MNKTNGMPETMNGTCDGRRMIRVQIMECAAYKCRREGRFEMARIMMEQARSYEVTGEPMRNIASGLPTNERDVLGFGWES